MLAPEPGEHTLQSATRQKSHPYSVYRVPSATTKNHTPHIHMIILFYNCRDTFMMQLCTALKQDSWKIIITLSISLYLHFTLRVIYTILERHTLQPPLAGMEDANTTQTGSTLETSLKALLLCHICKSATTATMAECRVFSFNHHCWTDHRCWRDISKLWKWATRFLNSL